MTIERLNLKSFAPAWVREEHLARYKFACQFVKGKSVIDCACGTGFGSEMLAMAGAQRVEAVDICEKAFAVSKKNPRDSKIGFHVADAASLPLPPYSADLYVSFETLEHLGDDLAYLSEATRVLKPDGIFLCSTPNRDLSNPGKSLQDRPRNPFHVREYSTSELMALLERRFKKIQLYGQNKRNLKWRHMLLNQIAKAPRLLWTNPKRHVVQGPVTMGSSYEYLIALCSNPI